MTAVLLAGGIMLALAVVFGVILVIFSHVFSVEKDAKAQEIADAIGMGGVFVSCDEGAIWLKRGTPWCQAIKDDTEPNIKRRYLNITAEFITPN